MQPPVMTALHIQLPALPYNDQDSPPNQLAVCHIRTSFGTSNTTLQNDDVLPFQGICQEIGAGPAVWIAISAPLIEMMQSAGHVLKFEAPLLQVADDFMGFAFVDDTNLVTGDLTSTDFTTEKVYDHMQQGINRWEGGL